MVRCAANTVRYAFTVATATSRRVKEASAVARSRVARAASTFAPRYPKSKGSQENRSPAALPQALLFEVDAGTGPEIGEMIDCGRSKPVMLLSVARFVCQTMSALGR